MSWMLRMLLLGVVLLATGQSLSARADYSQRPEVRAYVAEVAAEHGFAVAELTELFAQAEMKQGIIDSISRPAERVLKWHEYREIFLREPRISQGVEFWNEHEAVLEEAERVYGVAPEYVVAILGVETRYGRVMGNHRVLDALATLAFDYPPRSAFFRRELTQFLLLAREEGRNPLELMGSYAGAMGYGQFIPSSYRAYAVDFTGDGLRDIWSNSHDAVGSIANYFKRHGWRAGAPVALPVQVTRNVESVLATQALELKHTVADLARQGVAVDGLAPDQPAALFHMDGTEGDEYWLGLNNFYVITRYNRSRLYALAVHQLSQAIKDARQAQLAGR
jgi:membrane-bound lytic murein transglycosylase B